MSKNIQQYERRQMEMAKHLEKLQDELSEKIDQNADLEFKLSTLKFLEQQAEFEHHKLDDYNEEREKERQEFHAKYSKQAKELAEQKDANTQHLKTIKDLEDNLKDALTKLKSEETKFEQEKALRAQEFERFQKEIAHSQNDLRNLKESSANIPKLISRQDSNSESPSQDPNKKLNIQDKLQLELNQWKEQYLNEKNDKDRHHQEFQDLARQMHKKEEEFQKTIREWQSKYDQAMKCVDEKEEVLEEKQKEIANLQSKLYSERNCQDQNIQTDTGIHQHSKTNSISINVALMDEQDEQIIRTYKKIQFSSLDEMEQMLEEKDNQLMIEINRIIQFTGVPKYAEVEILKLRGQISALESQITYLHHKLKIQREKPKGSGRKSIKIHSVPSLDQSLECNQFEEEQLKGIIARLKSKIETLRFKNDDLQEQLQQLEKQLQILLSEKNIRLEQYEVKDKQQSQKIQILEKQLTKSLHDISKLEQELQRTITIKLKLQKENNDVLQDMEKAASDLKKNIESFQDLKIKQEELKIERDYYMKQYEDLNKRNCQQAEIIEVSLDKNAQITQQTEALEQ